MRDLGDANDLTRAAVSLRRFRNRATTVAVTLVLTSIASAIFAIFLVTDRSWTSAAMNGIGGSLVIATPTFAWLQFGLNSGVGRRLKRLPLLLYVAINSTIMGFVLLVGHLAAHNFIWRSGSRFMDAPYLTASLAFSVALVVTVSIAMELRRLIGPGVFGAVLLGRYRYPRAERRLVLMLDIAGSTALAERLGPERFLAFLDRWIRMLSEPLLATRGRIYRYVGDEAILTWEWRGDAVERALAFALAVTDAVAADADRWQRDFGAVPRMRIALHGGPVIAGEIGDLKREIALLGDTLNTASRIAGEARLHDALVLASAEAIEGVRLPPNFVRHDLGPVALRGKSEPVPLVRLTSAPPSP